MASTVFGIDYAWGRPGTAALHRAGAEFVCRYLSHDTSGKNLTRSEAAELSKAGIWIVVVWETTPSRALAGRAAGAADAAEAQRQAQRCGMPTGRPIYFAVDFDAQPDQQSAINAYLDGAAGVLGRSRVGLYGGYFPVKRALDAGKATWAWQTYAWSAGRWDRRAQIQQYSNEHRLNGVSVDYDRATTGDYGQWRIGVTPGEQDEVPDYVSLGVTEPQVLLAGEWNTIDWDHEYSDPTHQHAGQGGPSVLNGPARYALTAGLTFSGLSPGVEGQVRAIEVDAADASRFDAGPVAEFVSGGGDIPVLYALPANAVDAGRRVRLQVIHFGMDAATVVDGSLKVLYWRS